MTAEWGFTEAFRRADPERVRRLERTKRSIVQRIVGAYREQIDRIPGALKSLSGSQAKVWIRQDGEQTEALHGRIRPVPDIDMAHWIERLDDVVDTPRGPRWLARAGVIASPGRGAQDVKGGWLEGGEIAVDGY